MSHSISSASAIPALIVSGANKSFGTVRALNNVSMEIARGGVTAVLGQNGAGKTTLIRAALGLTSLDEGQIKIFGELSKRRVARQRVGIMLQDSDLPDLLTGRELVELFASYYPTPLSVQATIELADIAKFANKRYKTLSGGQKRRVQFALAIVGDPDLVFLDEPTTGLDPDARRALWSVVRSFVGDGKTILLTTHYLEEANTLADQVVVMREGCVVANAPIKEILTSLGGSVIRCQTSASLNALEQLPSVTNVVASGRIVEITSKDVVATLVKLLVESNEVTDLSVSRQSLENIFSQEFS